MTSARLMAENLKARWLFKWIANSNYDPAKFRSRVEHGEPVAGAGLTQLEHAHMEVWGASKPLCRVLYVPGGGFCFGPNDDHRNFLVDIGSRFSAELYLLNYRLAPEHPFPCALKDTEEAILQTASPDVPLIVFSDSAGCALTLSALMRLREASQFSHVSCCVYMSAYTDLAHTGWSLVTNHRRDPMFGAQALLHKANHYLQGHPPTDPTASPYWGDPHGLPASLFLVGSTEVMHDDSARMVSKGRHAGCDFRLRTYDRAPHDFPLNSKLPEAHQARQEIEMFVRQYVDLDHAPKQAKQDLQNHSNGAN